MPLRDHFRPPTSKKAAWEAFHAMWPAVMVQQLHAQLPEAYVAAPSVHLGAYMICDDVQKTYDELLAKGAKFEKPPQSQPWGVYCILLDSENNQIVLSSDR